MTDHRQNTTTKTTAPPPAPQQRHQAPPAAVGAAVAARPPWQDGAFSAVQLGALWATVGLVSYTTLSLLARTTLHSEPALQQLQREVPARVYERSLFVFCTAFLLDVLSLLFELKSSRLDVVLLPAFVKGMATLTNALACSGWATVGLSTSGRVVMVQRYVCWLHTTPTILMLVKMMSTNITRQQFAQAVVCVEVMLVTGLAASLTAGWWAAFWAVLSHVAFLPLLPYLHQGLTEASAVVSLRTARPTMTLVYYLTMLMWSGFGLVWDLRVFGFIDTHTEEVAYLFCDFAAKVLFSAGLMLSSFKGLESRRAVVMRQIQESHKQTLILELRRAIEQKDAFISSVSHELRTPLNGIIGISEGLLANCCGVLSESVRKQLFVVRTSGARLLALINDVMDAATLRQHRLVLKQERLELRQVVGDVVDLTRSLVDSDVSLRVDVPEGLEVWADSGRIIQILNNLLGNAAKFTHQGFIKVSAKWHDEQRQWVAIHVTDTGIGIPKQKLQAIFLPFEQVDGSISRQYGGFGLGLSITQELVKAHGGELWVKSKQHKGSQFVFTVPSYTGQKPLTPQQQQQLQARRAGASRTQNKLAGLSAAEALGAAPSSLTGSLSGSRRRNSRLVPPPSAPAAAGDVSSGRWVVVGGGAAAAKHGGREAAGALPSAVSAPPLANGTTIAADSAGTSSNGPLTADLLDSCVGEDFDKELPYDAAQLSALASCKPYTTTHSPTGSSHSGSMQRVGSNTLRHTSSMLSITAPSASVGRGASAAAAAAAAAAATDGAADDDALDITPVLPHRDQRPSQFACTGRYQVLSVDDDPVNQTVVQSLLASTGYEVVCLYNGQQTLEYIENAAVLPDLILLDMLMPDMSGPDVCRVLARRQPPLSVPIILVSALAEESSVVQGLDSGADDYITKPFRRAEFLARIRGKLQLANAGEQAPAQGPGHPSSDEPVVMCITDDEVNHIVLEGMLKSQNYRYQKVSSGAEALKLLEAAGNTPPHLVLLDAALPDTTGMEVLKTLRDRYSQVALPVIMLTARHNEKAIVQALDAGANDYAVKPFRRSELLARIRMHLRSSQKAAAAASPAPEERHSAELSFAGDFEGERISADLQQRSLRLDELSTVPLLVVQLQGVDEALASATAEQACQLMGFIADCFDALVEKYAFLKVEASDTSLTVAAPISVSSCQNSARNSMQLPVLQLSSTPGNSNTSLQLSTGADGGATGAAWQGAGGSAAAFRPTGALGSALLQMLRMGQELQAHLAIDAPHSSSSSSTTGSSTPYDPLSALAAQATPGCTSSTFLQPAAQQQQQQQPQGSAEGSRLRPHTPVQLLQAPAAQWWHDQLQLKMAVHVGPLTAGVVGHRRPRYRLMGPALDTARQACHAAPLDCIVATATAAELLVASGVQGIRSLSFHTAADGSREQQLWLLRRLSMSVHQPLLGTFVGGAGATGGGCTSNTTDGVLSLAAAALAGSARAMAAQEKPAPHTTSAADSGSISLFATTATTTAAAAAAAPMEQLRSAWLPSASVAGGQQQQQQQDPLPLQQQQQLMLQQQQQQQQQQQLMLLPSPCIVNGGLLPPPVLDPVALQGQQLLLQELSLFAQQLCGLSGNQWLGNNTGDLSSPLNCSSMPAPVIGTLPSAQPWSMPLGADGSLKAAQQPSLLDGLPVVACAAAPTAAMLPAAVLQASLPAGNLQLSSTGAAAPGSSHLGGSTAVLELTAAAALPTAASGAAPEALPLSNMMMLQSAAGCLTPQLGPAELQQLDLLHKELAALQQQLNAALGVQPTNGSTLHLDPGHQATLQQQQEPPRNSLMEQPCLNGRPRQQSTNHHATAGDTDAAAAGGSAAPAVAAVNANGAPYSSEASSNRSWTASSARHSESEAGSEPQQAAQPAQQASSKDRPKGQFLGRLLSKRRSRKP